MAGLGILAPIEQVSLTDTPALSTLAAYVTEPTKWAMSPGGPTGWRVRYPLSPSEMHSAGALFDAHRDDPDFGY